MVFYDLFLPHYRDKRIKDSGLFLSNSSGSYNSDSGEVIPIKDYSLEEKYNISKLNKWIGRVAAFASIPLLAGSILLGSSKVDFKSIEYKRFLLDKEYGLVDFPKKQNSNLEFLVLVPFLFFGITRNMNRSKKWGSFQEYYKKFIPKKI